MDQTLFEKYNVRVPRYTSYPAVPNWQKEMPTQENWLHNLNQQLTNNNEVSLYIHLPFCEKLCTYCACNKRITTNHKVESPYIDALLEEWEIYKRHLIQTPIIKELHLGGGTPTFFSPKELERLLSGILSSTTLDDSHSYSFEAHPNSTTINHLNVLYKYGFRRISIGVQDVSEKVLKAINRDQSKDQIVQVTSFARALGYTSINYDIIYGLPYQSINHIKDTCAFIAEMKPDRLAFYGYAHVPWQRNGQRAFTEKDIATGHQKQNLKDVGEQLLLKSGYHPIGMDHYALKNDPLYFSQKKGRLHRNFMGFTEHNTSCVLALGNSGISDCGSMYVQNEKSVEKYQLSIKQGRLPVVKGHHLNSIEQRTKKHILNLICKRMTVFDDDPMDQDIFSSTIPKLEGLREDGLLILQKNGLLITKKGMPFVRNICAAIDPFINQDTTSKVFSSSI